MLLGAIQGEEENDLARGVGGANVPIKRFDIYSIYIGYILDIYIGYILALSGQSLEAE